MLADHARTLQALREQVNTPLQTQSETLGPTHDSEAEIPAVMPPPGIDAPTPVDYLAPMTIPIGHATTTGNLLQARPVKALIGDYSSDIFLRIEQKRPVPPELSLAVQPGVAALPTLDPASVTTLIEHYFQFVDPQHPILQRDEIEMMVGSLDPQVVEWSNEWALLLMILAVAQAHRDLSFAAGDDLPGIEYLQPGVQYLLRTWADACATDVLLSQAFFLAALYYASLCRPLQAWRLAHMASTNIQHAFFQQPDQHNESLLRTCWALFLLECDLVAEYHLPRSGIENLVDQLPYPDCAMAEVHESSWLAIISSRKLLNRIHCTMYASHSFVWDSQPTHDLPPPVPRPLLALSGELSHQLQAWWDLVPESLKPELNKEDPTPEEGILLLRFHACGDIITRPFLHHVCSYPDKMQPPSDILDLARACIENCRAFIHMVPSELGSRHPLAVVYLHSCDCPYLRYDSRLMDFRTLAAMINLALASHCCWLWDDVSDIDILEEQAVFILERWAELAPSAEAMLRLVVALRDKGRTVRMMR